jgi:hypothetical protein
MTKMIRANSRSRSAAAAFLGLLALAGCTQEGPAGGGTTPVLSLTPTDNPPGAGSASVSASAAMSARDAKIAAGTEAIRAYRQMIFDIYADPTPNPQDMSKVATGDLLASNTKRIETQLAAGWKNTEGKFSVKWVKPVAVGKTEVRLYACVDPGGVRTGKGRPTTLAEAEALDYVVQASEGHWLVSGTYTHGGGRSVKKC